MDKFIAYYRVSTKDQNLGIEAQKRLVQNFISDKDDLIESYEERETGTRKKVRVELNKAIEKSLKENATLLIAKLDRLARNVYFVSKLMETGVRFKALDMPEADNFTIHIFAALAEKEAQLISSRTKSALKELKAQGVKLGGTYNLTNADREKARIALRTKKRSNPNTVKASWAIVKMLNEEKNYTLQEMADELNLHGFRTPRGHKFYPKQISRLIQSVKINSN